MTDNTNKAPITSGEALKIARDALAKLANGASNVAMNADIRGDSYDVGYAKAMEQAANDALDATASTAPAPVAQSERDALDAKRYRWLRDQMRFTQSGDTDVEMYLRDPIPTQHHDVHRDWQEHLWDATVDATVDAAIAAQQPSDGVEA